MGRPPVSHHRLCISEFDINIWDFLKSDCTFEHHLISCSVKINMSLLRWTKYVIVTMFMTLTAYITIRPFDISGKKRKTMSPSVTQRPLPRPLKSTCRHGTQQENMLGPWTALVHVTDSTTDPTIVFSDFSLVSKWKMAFSLFWEWNQSSVWFMFIRENMKEQEWWHVVLHQIRLSVSFGSSINSCCDQKGRRSLCLVLSLCFKTTNLHQGCSSNVGFTASVISELKKITTKINGFTLWFIHFRCPWFALKGVNRIFNLVVVSNLDCIKTPGVLQYSWDDDVECLYSLLIH